LTPRTVQIAVATVRRDISATRLDEAVFCCFSPDMLALYRQVLEQVKQP
jgi:hypothetical protein